MKAFFFTAVIAFPCLTLMGCNSEPEVTVNPAPTMSNDDFLEMERESEQSRLDAIRDSGG